MGGKELGSFVSGWYSEIFSVIQHWNEHLD